MHRPSWHCPHVSCPLFALSLCVYTVLERIRLLPTGCAPLAAPPRHHPLPPPPPPCPPSSVKEKVAPSILDNGIGQRESRGEHPAMLSGVAATSNNVNEEIVVTVHERHANHVVDLLDPNCRKRHGQLEIGRGNAQPPREHHQF